MKILIALLLLTVSVSVSAVEKIWRWDAVVEDTNNQPITVDAYNVYCEDNEPIQVLGNILEYKRNLPPGSYGCFVTAVLGSEESEPSNTAMITIISVPKPTIITIVVEG